MSCSFSGVKIFFGAVLSARGKRAPNVGLGVERPGRDGEAGHCRCSGRGSPATGREFNLSPGREGTQAAGIIGLMREYRRGNAVAPSGWL
jgi:hypothetical protein